jgi:bidirectional [NiFe] hydrogenase diaphorase subunit
MSKKVTLRIDGLDVSAFEGEKLLFVALRNGIYIPHLCAIKEEERPSACCRLCFVEVDGKPRPVTACTQAVYDKMSVKTRTPKVDRLVKTAFELILSDHRLGCCNCGRNGSCELQKIAKSRGLKLKVKRFKQLQTDIAVDNSPATFSFDATRCVLCGQCVYADQQVAKVGAIGFVCRGLKRKVGTFDHRCLSDSPCIECGLCVEACPVGALIFNVKK